MTNTPLVIIDEAVPIPTNLFDLLGKLADSNDSRFCVLRSADDYDTLTEVIETGDDNAQ